MNSWTKNLLIAGGLGAGAVLATRAYLRYARWFSFQGRVVVITGGSRGLGLVMARRLVDEGARVAICARTKEDLLAAEQELKARGGDVMSACCDVREEEQVQIFIADVLKRWGKIDVLINNAGIIEVGPVDAMTKDDFLRSMDTHCWGALHLTLAVLPAMRRRGWGRVVNIASLGGKRAVPHMLPYAASKFALVGLSQGLRSELAKDGILVTTICPGLMRTGSPRNATFKGRHREEYAWFNVSDSLPLVAMDADSAAKKILRACQFGEAEAVITGPGNLAVALQTMAPNLVSELASLVNYLLPAMGGIGREEPAATKAHRR